MQRAAASAHQAAPTAAVAATKALVAPLVQLVGAADDAKQRGRQPRALELYERALVLAGTTMSASTLLAPLILQQISAMRMALAVGGAAVTSEPAVFGPLFEAAWRGDEQAAAPVAALFRASARSLGSWHAPDAHAGRSVLR
jgi:hypothetical protein